MKKTIFLFLVTLSFIISARAQCISAASGFGNNTSTTMYNVLGNVEVVLNSNNTITVNLMSNFSTAAGPDVRIFLVDRGNLSNDQLKTSSNFLNRPKIEMGFSPVSGTASFTKEIPLGINISDFETVYFYCQAFSQFWDYGSFTAYNTSNCSVLGTNTFENNKFQLYPNPATTELNIQLEANVTNYDVAIYNTLGSLVYKTNNKLSNSNSTINISKLNTGIYFVKITDASNKTYQKRLIKK